VLWVVLGYAESWWPATLLMFAPRWIFALPLAVLIPGSLYAGWRTVVVVLFAGLVACGPVMGFNIPWQRLTTSTPAGTSFRVLTCNMHDTDLEPTLLDNFILATAPDIVVVQEWGRSRNSVLRSIEGWHIPPHKNRHFFLASRHPIRQVVNLGHESMSDGAAVTRYELETPAGIVTVFTLHLATTRYGIYNTIHQNPNGPAEVQENSDLRRTQSEFVASQAAACQEPVLIMGDFNTPPESPFFSQIWSPYTDAFTAAGWGLGYTFLGAKTTVRIDHILTGSGWACTKCWVGPEVGSPHRPVIADLVWTEGRQGEGG
jgi:endonuclease/exonuclease/phosphatase (EEP) superfamily protein YafD